MFCHNKCKCCLFSWLSGFFALATLAHIIRLITKAQVQVGDWAVPMSVSIAIVVVAGILSLTFCKMGCKACTCGTASK